MLEKEESFKWNIFHQVLSYLSNVITPYPILQKTENLPSGIIFEKWCQDLGLDIVVLTMAKFQKKSIQAFLRKLQVKFQGVKIQQKPSYMYFKSYREIYPQELTKWSFTFKLILYHLITTSENLREIPLFLTFRKIGLIINWRGVLFYFYQKLPLKLLNWAGIKLHLLKFFENWPSK